MCRSKSRPVYTSGVYKTMQPLKAERYVYIDRFMPQLMVPYLIHHFLNFLDVCAAHSCSTDFIQFNLCMYYSPFGCVFSCVFCSLLLVPDIYIVIDHSRFCRHRPINGYFKSGIQSGPVLKKCTYPKLMRLFIFLHGSITDSNYSPRL